MERPLTPRSAKIAKYRRTPEGPLKRLTRYDGSEAPYGSIRFAGSKRMPSKWACISDVSALSTHAGP